MQHIFSLVNRFMKGMYVSAQNNVVQQRQAKFSQKVKNAIQKVRIYKYPSSHSLPTIL